MLTPVRPIEARSHVRILRTDGCGKSVSLDLDKAVTTVILHRPLADAVGRYEDWLKEIVPAAQRFAGHQGVNVIRPHGSSDAYTIVLHFDTVEHLRA